MTRDEFVKKYGQVKVKFASYYKYSFTYKGRTDDGLILSVVRGGDSGEIYRDHVTADEIVTVADLYPYAASVSRDGVEIEAESYYEY